MVSPRYHTVSAGILHHRTRSELKDSRGEIFRGLKGELGWAGPLVHGHKPFPKGIVYRRWRKGKLLGHLALGLVGYGLMEEMAHRLELSL